MQLILHVCSKIKSNQSAHTCNNTISRPHAKKLQLNFKKIKINVKLIACKFSIRLDSKVTLHDLQKSKVSIHVTLGLFSGRDVCAN